MANQHKTCLVSEEEIAKVEKLAEKDRRPFSSMAGFIIGEWLKSPQGQEALRAAAA